MITSTNVVCRTILPPISAALLDASTQRCRMRQRKHPRDVARGKAESANALLLHSSADVATMKVLVSNGAPPQCEGSDANQQRGGNCYRTWRECRRRRDTRARPALSGQVAAPERIVAGGVAADAVHTEATGAHRG